MLKLYQREECPHSHRVREKLTELGLRFESVPVPREPGDRKELRDVSGDTKIPVLVNEQGKAIADSQKIIEYLDAAFGKNGKRAPEAGMREP